MKEITIKAASKTGMLLKHLRDTGMTSIWAGDAALVMGCKYRQVARMCSALVLDGVLRMVWRPDGQHYELADRVTIGLHGNDVMVSMPTSAPPMDLCDEILTVRRSWVQAAGLKPPFTTGTRSVFDLAGGQHA